MTVKNHYFQSISELKQNLDLSKINSEKTLLQIFSGFIKELEIQEIIDIITSKDTKVTFIGTTTAGEIYNGQIGTQGIVISVMEFSDTAIKSGYFVNKDEFSLGIDIASRLYENNTKAMILFIDGLLTNGSNVIDGIASVNNTIPIAGGMSGDNGNFLNTFVFCNDGIYNKGAVAVSLQSEVLEVYTDYQLNWQPIGKEMTVTKINGTRLYEIDGINISELYGKYLGPNIKKSLPHSAIEFPLIKKDSNGLEICRTFVHQFEDGSMQTIGNLYEGDKVRFAFGNVNMVLDSTKEKTKELNNYYPEAMFTYSCASRITFMQSDVVKELEPLNHIAPISGFFTYGEIFHKNGQNHLLNISLTILMLSERNSTQDFTQNIVLDKTENSRTCNNFFNDKHFLVLDALTSLTNQVISELDEQKQKIEELHKHTKDSIEYASLIQQAIVPDNEVFKKYFSDFFVIWQPKDIVGGDVYLFEELRHDDECLIMVIDCTGHGVPGAFVTMLVKAIERQIAAVIASNDDIEVSPSWILSYFNQTMKKLLKQEDSTSVSNAGFDGGIIYYNKKVQQLKFAGAETALFYIDENNQFKRIKGSRHSIGYKRSDVNFDFKEHIIDVKEGMQFYLTTDGYLDQNGGKKGFCFGRDNFKSIIEKSFKRNCTIQKDTLLKELVEYQGEEDRNDDITVIGLKI